MFSLLTWLTRVKILHKQLQFWDHEKYKGWGGCILFAGPWITIQWTYFHWFFEGANPWGTSKKKHDEDVGPPSFHLILQGATPTCVHPTGHVFGWTWEFGGRVQARDFVSLEFWGSNSSKSQDYSEEWILKNFYHLATLPILDWDWKKGDDYPQHAKLCFPRPKETLATGVWLRPMWLFLSIALIYIIQLWKSLQGFLGTIFGSNYSVRTATTATTTTAAKQ